MTAPSRDTAGRRRRELIARSRQLDETLGPDQSTTVFDYRDGWTVRRVSRLEDQRREGQLMRNCLRHIETLDPNVYSLRDVDNLPHLTFSTYRVGPDDNLDEIPLDKSVSAGGTLVQFQFVHAGDALFIADTARTRGLRPERREQLVTYGHHGNPADWERFPADTRGRGYAVLPFMNLDGAALVAARRMIEARHPGPARAA